MSEGVLVTGATGGLGLSLVEALVKGGRKVVATGRDRAKGEMLESMGASFVPANLETDDLERLGEGVGTVFHLAALSSPWGPTERFEAINHRATLRLLDAARATGCGTFVYTSTPSIYTRAQDQIGLSESSPLPAKPANAYAATKLAGERAVLAAARESFDTVALRPRAIIGPHDTVLLPRLLRAASKGVMPLPGMGRALIEPTDARDVVSALLAAEARASEVSGEVFNISGGQALTLRDLASHAFVRMGKTVHLVPLPARAVLALAAVAEAIAKIRPGRPEPALTRYSAKALGWSQTFDLTKAKTRLGWSPRHAPFEAIDWALQEMAHA